MRPILIVSVALLAACASGGNTPMGGSERTIHLADGTGGFLRMSGSDARLATVAAPMDKVWRVLPGIYDSLGIKLTDLDPKTHLLGNSGMKAHKSLGNTSLAKYIDCGSTQGFPSADSYDIQMSVRTQIDSAAGGGTTVGTLVEASGRPMAFAGEAVRCTSTGQLETRISEAVKAQLRP
jgi:hypothetical protein